jgi:predicted SAM-dependent methyltransferase
MEATAGFVVSDVMKLNLGCGDRVIDGWTNVDYALGARLSKLPFFSAVNRRVKLFNLDWDRRIVLHNLTTRFPWPDSSVDVVYSSHTLEHFRKEDGRAFLKECHRVLRGDGIIRIVVPDLRVTIQEYIDGRLPADDFVGKLDVLFSPANGMLRTQLAALTQLPHAHKCMYDSKRLVEVLDELGFTASSRAAFDSDIEDIEAIEAEGRTENAVVVEGRKR